MALALLRVFSAFLHDEVRRQKLKTHNHVGNPQRSGDWIGVSSELFGCENLSALLHTILDEWWWMKPYVLCFPRMLVNSHKMNECRKQRSKQHAGCLDCHTVTCGDVINDPNRHGTLACEGQYVKKDGTRGFSGSALLKGTQSGAYCNCSPATWIQPTSMGVTSNRWGHTRKDWALLFGNLLVIWICKGIQNQSSVRSMILAITNQISNCFNPCLLEIPGLMQMLLPVSFTFTKINSWRSRKNGSNRCQSLRQNSRL